MSLLQDKSPSWLRILQVVLGLISIGLSMVVAQQLPQISDNVITLILFSVLVFEIAGPILAKFAITKAGEIESY